MNKKLLSLILPLIVLCACSTQKDITPSVYPTIEESQVFIQTLSNHKPYKFEEYSHSDIAIGFFDVPEDTEDTKYIDDYYNVIMAYGREIYENDEGVILFTDKHFFPETFEKDRQEVAYRSKCYENGKYEYSERDSGYVAMLADSYSNIKDNRDVFYFYNEIDTDCELNTNSRPLFITPWSKERHEKYMFGNPDKKVYGSYDIDSALPGSFYPLDGVCAYQYGVAIFYENDYSVRAIAYKDSDEARAVVDEFCEFYGVPTPAEYYGE